MTTPSYTEDLTDIDLAQNTTGYVAYGGGASGLGSGADFSMQDNVAVDKQITNAEKGILFNNGAGITIPAGDHVFIWHFTATPGVCDLLVNRGAVINIGNAATAFCKYHVEGGDTYGAGGRVGKCYPVDPTVYTANTGSIPYRTLVGSPSGAFQYFGSGLNTNATVKSANMGLDAQRYGTGAYLTAGELIGAGDASDDPCTFAGFANQNDAVANRWGIYNELNELQGMFAIGQNNTGVATLARFEDSDVNITFVDTPHAASDFTQIVIDHASTVANLTNINIEAKGTINKGRFIVNAANPTVAITGGTWTGIGITTLRSNTSVDGLVWRGTDQITINSASITNFLIDKNVAVSALVTDDLGNLTSGEFISDGTGYAVDLGTIAATATQTWDCKETGYVTGASGTNVGVTPTGNETILVSVDSGQTLTINVATGASTPSVANSGLGQVDIVSGLITLSVTVLDNSTGLALPLARVRLMRSSDKSVLINAETSGSGIVTASIAYDADTSVEGWARQMDLVGTDYIPKDFGGEYTSGGFSATVRLEPITI